MIVLQLIIVLFVPAVMVVLGRRNKKSPPAYCAKKMAYSSKRAKSSKDAWREANQLFANLLYMSGWNVGVVSFVFFAIVSFMGKGNWLLCLVFPTVQLIGGILLTRVVTEGLLRRRFDKNGAEREEEELEVS